MYFCEFNLEAVGNFWVSIDLNATTALLIEKKQIKKINPLILLFQIAVFVHDE